jgi:hypothetical protein
MLALRIRAVPDLKHFEAERPQLVDGVDDVGKETDGTEDDAGVDASDFGNLLGQARRPPRLEEGMRRRHDARQQTQLGRSESLRVLSNERLARHGE